MPVVRLKDNEPFESGMRRFKRTIEKIGLLTELRAREFMKNRRPSEKEKSSCRKRHHKRIRSQMIPTRKY